MPGVGLGLAVAARIATALGGVDHRGERVERRSRVRVRLADATAPDEAATPTPVPLWVR